MLSKTLILSFIGALTFVIHSPANAFSSYIRGADCHIEVNTWNAVVTPTSLYVPGITVKTKGFNDETYKLDVKWEKKQEQKVVNRYGGYYNNKGKYKTGYHEEIVYSNKWVPTEVKKNGQESDPYNYSTLLPELFEDLTGIKEAIGLSNMNSFGAQENFAGKKEVLAHRDAYGNVLYTNDYVYKLEVYPIYSRMNGIIVGHESLYISGNYYPVLDETLDNSELFTHTYKYQKNASGVWKQCEAKNKYKDEGWKDSWENATDRYAPKLDELKSALGI